MPRKRVDDELLKSVGVIFREVREGQGLSQKSAAAKIGGHPYQISHLENGVADVRLSTLRKWAEAYGYSLEVHLTPLEDEFDKALREAVEELEAESVD